MNGIFWFFLLTIRRIEATTPDLNSILRQAYSVSAIELLHDVSCRVVDRKSRPDSSDLSIIRGVLDEIFFNVERLSSSEERPLFLEDFKSELDKFYKISESRAGWLGWLGWNDRFFDTAEVLINSIKTQLDTLGT
jgi:hypothetical protein